MGSINLFDNFINGIKNGFKTANATRKFVFGDKQLFMYPILSLIIGIIAAAIILGVGIGIFIFAGLSTMHSAAPIILFIIDLVILYLVVFFITTYFTIAMLIAFREYTKGKRIGIGDALGRTAPYMTLILEWTVFYTIIVTIIHIIEGLIRAAFSRFGFIGNIISGVLTGSANLALAAAVAFALPVIIDEKKGPIDTIKLSTSFIMKNFGETFGGLVFAEIFQIALTLMGLGLIFIAILPFLLARGAVSSALVAVSITLAAVGFLMIIAGVLLRYVLFNCFKLIVYDYKTRKTLPKGFDSKLIDSSIKKKKQQRSGFGGSPVGFFGSQQGSI